MSTERTVGDGLTLELALHGPDPGPELDELRRELTAAGAASVEQVRLTAPESDQRVAELVEVTTLLVGGVANVVAMVETVRNWLARRRAAASRRPDTSPEDTGVPTVVITLGDQTLTLVDPPDRALSDAIARFYEHHRRD